MMAPTPFNGSACSLMPSDESSILRLANIIQDAVVLGQALLDGDAAEARLRADRVLSRASDGGLSRLAMPPYLSSTASARPTSPPVMDARVPLSRSQWKSTGRRPDN